MKHGRFMRAALISSLLFSSTLFAKGNVQAIDGIAIVVNDTAIMQSEINEGIRSYKAQLNGANIPLPPYEILRTKVVDQLIARKLQLQLAEQSGIKVSDADVDQMIAKIAKENDVSTEVLYEKVATQNLTRTEYRKDIREELILQQIEQQQVGSKITMTPEDVKNFMRSKAWQAAVAPMPAVNEYHVEDLIILVPESSSAQTAAAAKTQAQALFKQAKQGTPFSTLASNTQNLQNNDLGWRKLNELPSAFADVVEQAKKNSVMGPIQTGNGFHIIRLTDIRQDKSSMPQQQAMPTPTEKEAEQMVYQKKFADALKKWVAKLRSQAVVNMHPESMG